MGRRRKRTRRNDRTGGLAIWKPAGPTSRDIVDAAEKKLGFGPLGHTGTLDPLASGVMVLLGGQGRKFQELLMKRTKEYVATIELGVCSGSDDAEGPLWCPVPRGELPNEAELREALTSFEGGYDQIPPQLSAVRLEGKRAYELARKGEVADLQPRSVVIHELELLQIDGARVDLRVRCGSGTYLRSLARDLGDRLGVGGYLLHLERTESSGHRRETTIAIDDLVEGDWCSLETLLAAVPRIDIDEEEIGKLAQGQRIRYPHRQTPFEGRGVAWVNGRVAGIVDVFHSMVEPRRWLQTPVSPSSPS